MICWMKQNVIWSKWHLPPEESLAIVNCAEDQFVDFVHKEVLQIKKYTASKKFSDHQLTIYALFLSW